jgi:hypothetical protein
LIVLVLPRETASDVDLVVDLKHHPIGWSTRAPMANAIVEPNEFIPEIAPFGPMIVIHPRVSESRLGHEL